MHNYEVQKAGIHLNSHLKDVIIAHHDPPAPSPIPSLGSLGVMSNFLGAASADTSDPDISKMVEQAFEKHHLSEKIANLKQLQKKAPSSAVNVDKMVADTMK